MTEIEKVQSYFAWTHTHAVYPGTGTLAGLEYTRLGLFEETGEVAGHAKRVLRDDSGVVTAERRERILCELGDVAWYVSESLRCGDMEIGLEAIAHNVSAFKDGPAWPMPLSECVSLLNVRAAEFSREGVLFWIHLIAESLGSTIGEVLEINRDKLDARAASGTLHGEGDDR